MVRKELGSGTIRIEDAALELYRQTCKGAGKPKAAPPGLKHITPNQCSFKWIVSRGQGGKDSDKRALL